MRTHRPRKRFGQHFLVDHVVIDEIVAAIAPRRGDRMVEIGPGLGALTKPLVALLDQLNVIEIDRDIVGRLRAEFPPGRLVVHEGDALKFDFSAVGSDLRIVGNLPYNISTPLLFHLADYAPSIRDIHVMLQKEVVERMVAAPSSSAFGRLSVMLQYRFQLTRILEVSAAAFKPAPEVESALVRMAPYRLPPHPARDESLFAVIVAQAFSQRRKTLRNTLKGRFGAEDFKRLNIDPGLRAQDLSVADFTRLSDYAAAASVR